MSSPTTPETLLERVADRNEAVQRMTAVLAVNADRIPPDLLAAWHHALLHYLECQEAVTDGYRGLIDNLLSDLDDIRVETMRKDGVDDGDRNES